MSEKYVARSSAIAARMLGGEMMIMSAVDSTFFTLNEVATAIWHAADGIVNDFEVEPEVAIRDAEQFVDELSPYGILLVSDRPFDTASSGPTEAA